MIQKTKIIKLFICALYILSLGCSIFNSNNLNLIPGLQPREPGEEAEKSSEDDTDFVSGSKLNNFKIPLIIIKF